jgi:hypothetical protein
VAAGKERGLFRGHSGAVCSLSFSHDSARLASAGDDWTALVWDLTDPFNEGRSPVGPRSAPELDNYWSVLADEDAPAAYRAVIALARSPDRSVDFLKRRLRPVEAADRQRVTSLLAALDSSDFAERENAARELERLGFTAEPALREALTAKPSLEVRRRVEQVLAKLEGTPTLRVVRAVEALERIGTPEARLVLNQAGSR